MPHSLRRRRCLAAAIMITGATTKISIIQSIASIVGGQVSVGSPESPPRLGSAYRAVFVRTRRRTSCVVLDQSSLRPSCRFTSSRHPIRAFKYNSPSLPLTRSSLIGVTPSGGRVPKIVATMKWPTLAFSLVAPVCSSFPKCRRSVFRQIGLSRRSRTNKQICPSGIPRLGIRPHRIAGHRSS
jgi:hypothetical protein